MKKDIFISYSSNDFDKVNNVKHILEINGISCWMAPQSIPTGSSYAKEIPVAIRNCKVFLLMITSKSQESQWVSKEVSLALSECKCVMPFVIEDCILTDMFNFFLTDIQRYYAFDLKSDSLRELIERIRLECDKESGIQNSFRIDEVSNVETWIVSKDRNVLNREFTKFLTLLKKEYRNNPNAESIEIWVDKYIVECYAIRAIMESLDKYSIFLTGAAEAKIQLAVIYIHSGAKKYIKKARDLLNSAIKTYLNQSTYYDMAFKRIIYSRWLIAVTYKQERNFGYANELCEDLIEYINDENQVFDVPYSDSLLLPQRELIVINKEEIMSDYLLIHLDDISMNPKELFYTQRRLLELYILNNDFEKAKGVLPELLVSFERCKGFIDEIYHVGLYQNLFEYYSYVGDKESAEKYYRMALENAKKNYWKGKEKKLTNLKQIFE
ncbi:MAG: toll/interleukin-1 receptor domain-containing protein [Eubacterium sp.]|nr:toll/interleukin-1 receptor domain-containing protein [Eubacterium sp.]